MASEVELSTPTRMHIGLLSHDDPRHGESWTGGDSDNFVTTSEEDSFDSEDMEEDTDEDLEQATFCSLTQGSAGQREMRRLRRAMTSTATGYMCANAVQLIDLAFVGHLDTRDLAAMNLANVVMYGSLVFVTGVCDALAGLCTQAYEVAKDFVKDGSQSKAKFAYSRVGLWLQVALVWISIILIPPTALIWCFTGDILFMFGACEPTVCDAADSFAQLSILWLWPYSIFTMLTIYLESIEVVAPQQYIQMAFVGLNIILDWVFIYGVGPIGGLGFTGSPIAAAVSRLAQVLVLVVYIWGIPFVGPIKKRLPQVADTWGDGWSVRAFSWQRGYDFMMEGLPFGLTEVLSDWVFEIVIVLAGTLGTVQAAAVGTLINMVVFFQPLFISLYTALQHRVDKNLCNNNPVGAQRTFATGFLIALGSGVVVSVLIVLFKRVLANIYTSDPAVIAMFVSLTPIAAFHYLLSGVTFTFQGVLEGQYRIRVVMAGTILGSWGTGIAGMAILIYGMHYRVHALWWALCIGEAMHSFILFIVLHRTDWAAQAEEAVQRQAEMEAQYDVIAEECEQSMILLSTKDSFNSYGASGNHRFGQQTPEQYNKLSDIQL